MADASFCPLNLVRSFGAGAAAGALALGPWLAAASPTDATALAKTRVDPIVAIGTGAFGQPGFEGQGGGAGCGCDSVVINAVNKVIDAKIRSGDAEVRNFNLTYITASFMASIEGDFHVKVKQRAKARSGDAIAGQVIGALAKGSKCKNVVIRAVNVVKDVKVRTGDAIAKNRNLVLLDPGIDQGRIRVRADQVAEADVGDAIAGQVIGASGSGRDARGCGSLKIEADNRVRDTKIKTGDAESDNDNDIRTCDEPGCIEELLDYVDDVGSIRVCSADGCRVVSSADLERQLLASLVTPAPLPPPAEPVPGERGDQQPAEPEEEPDASASSSTPTPSPEPPPGNGPPEPEAAA